MGRKQMYFTLMLLALTTQWLSEANQGSYGGEGAYPPPPPTPPSSSQGEYDKQQEQHPPQWPQQAVPTQDAPPPPPSEQPPTQPPQYQSYAQTASLAQYQSPFGQQQQQQQQYGNPHAATGDPRGAFGASSPPGSFFPPGNAPSGTSIASNHGVPLDSGGLFGKLKQGLNTAATAASSALTGAYEAGPGSLGPYDNGGYYPNAQQQQQQQQHQHHHHHEQYGQPQHHQQYGRQQQPVGHGGNGGGGGLFGKLKSLFKEEDSPSGHVSSGQQPPYGAHHFEQQQQQQQPSAGSAPQMWGQQQQPFGGYPGHSPDASSASGEFRDPFAAYAGPSSSPSGAGAGAGAFGDGPFPHASQVMSPPPPPPSAMEQLVSPEPSVTVVEGSVVFVNSPRELQRKKKAFKAAGPGAIQVFTDFERVLGHFQGTDGSLAMGTAELLEVCHALAPASVAALRAVADEYEQRDGEMADVDFQSYGRRCQEIIATEGNLHIARIAPATRDFLKSLALRDGWKDVFTALTSKSVPTYIFSSGYGDIVAQALIQSGNLPGAALPQNVRIISNFFRTAPDGTVRAFSSPIVHERNKNARTAGEHMGMSPPERKHSLVFGAHEDDVFMGAGTSDVEETLSVGFLEIGEDLVQRLPAFLTTFDVVIVGDGNFHYVSQLVHEVLGMDGVSQGSSSKKLFETFGRAFGKAPMAGGGGNAAGTSGFAAGASMGDIF